MRSRDIGTSMLFCIFQIILWGLVQKSLNSLPVLRPLSILSSRISFQQPLPSQTRKQGFTSPVSFKKQNLAWGQAKLQIDVIWNFKLPDAVLLPTAICFSSMQWHWDCFICVCSTKSTSKILIISPAPGRFACLGCNPNIHQAHQSYEQNNFSPKRGGTGGWNLDFYYPCISLSDTFSFLCTGKENKCLASGPTLDTLIL